MRKVFVTLVPLVAFLLVIGSCATDRMAYISRDYEIYGTWENPEYDDQYHNPAVVVIHPDHLSEQYDTLQMNRLGHENWYDITNKWFDSEGNAWYTLIFIEDDGSYSYGLCKLSDAGNTLEGMWSADDYPKTIIPGNLHTAGDGIYNIWYRR